MIVDYYPPPMIMNKSYDPILANNTWEQIANASLEGVAPQIWDPLDIENTKDLTLTTGETLSFGIAGFNHDDLADGAGKAGITFAMRHLMAETRRMNDENITTGGFPAMELHDWMNTDLWNLMPDDVKPHIAPAYKKTSAGNRSDRIITYETPLFLFTEIEVFGEITTSFAGEGTQYTTFENVENRIKWLGGNINATNWWLSSPNNATAYPALRVLTSGTVQSGNTTAAYGVCFGFCFK